MIVKREPFGEEEIFSFDNGELSFGATTFGAIITAIRFMGQDCVAGHKDFLGYKNDRAAMGGLVGRVANRIKDGTFCLDKKEWILDKNELGNCLHGGWTRFEKLHWDATLLSNGVEFSHISPAGEQGFPGDLSIKARYTIEGNLFIMDLSATTSEKTIVSLTNHNYYTLISSSVENEASQSPNPPRHTLYLNCDEYLEVDDTKCPTGRRLLATCDFDFHSPRVLSRDYDTCFLTHAKERDVVKAAILNSNTIKMTLWTNQRGVQLYTAGRAVCLETQRLFYDIPLITLNTGEVYRSLTKLEFEKN